MFANHPFTFNTLPDFISQGTGIEFRCFPDGSAAKAHGWMALELCQ